LLGTDMTTPFTFEVLHLLSIVCSLVDSAAA